MQLRWRADALWALTHGRGVYRLTLEPVAVSMGPLDDSACDGDGILERGATAELPIQITNRSGSPLTGLTLDVSTDNTDLAILDQTAPALTLDAGASDTVTLSLQLSAAAACASSATLTLELSFDGGSQTETLELLLAADRVRTTGTLIEDAEDDDTLFTHAGLWAPGDWQRVTNQAATGNASWYTSNDPVLSDKSLFSPWLEVMSPTAEASFAIYYHLESSTNQVWDGATLQIRERGGDWLSVETSVPYDGQYRQFRLLEFQPCWSGDMRLWRTASVSLSSYVGQEIQLRWRIASDSNTAEDGFYLDDIRVTEVSWWEAETCDETVCQSCFADNGEALDAVLASLGAGDWPDRSDIRDYVALFDLICPE